MMNDSNSVEIIEDAIANRDTKDACFYEAVLFFGHTRPIERETGALKGSLKF